MNPTVSKIRIYPIKSLDPVELEETVIGNSSLLHDREFAMINNDGKFISGKFTPKVNLLRSVYDLTEFTVTFIQEGENDFYRFSLSEDKKIIGEFLSDYFGYTVSIIQNTEGRFQDVPDIGGITILSEASLRKLTEYFPGIRFEQMRNRFRANIELTNTEAFWEDKLFAEPGSVIEYQINDITLFGINPRERCIVPTRDPLNGETYHRFTKQFVKVREKTLPDWSRLRDYGHYYFLTVDTFIPLTETGKVIRLGDELKFIGKKKLSALNI